MADETFFMGFLDDDKSVINKSSPQARGVGDVLIAFSSNASMY